MEVGKEAFREDMILIERIRKSEKQIKKEKFTTADTDMSDEEIDDLLMN